MRHHDRRLTPTNRLTPTHTPPRRWRAQPTPTRLSRPRSARRRVARRARHHCPPPPCCLAPQRLRSLPARLGALAGMRAWPCDQTLAPPRLALCVSAVLSSLTLAHQPQPPTLATRRLRLPNPASPPPLHAHAHACVHGVRVEPTSNCCSGTSEPSTASTLNRFLHPFPAGILRPSSGRHAG